MRFRPSFVGVLLAGLVGLSGSSLAQEEAEQLPFQSDISRLLNVVTRSIYHHRDVFLRELTSNSGDALEKTRLSALRNPEILEPAPALNISIVAYPGQNTLVIRDSGIGMSKEELSTNLGTIARSGTSKFMDELESGDAGNLIGQFGLGFYSSFLVADRVSVASKSVQDDTQWIFESSADAASYSIRPDPRGNTLGRGTEITLHLKPDSAEYLDQDTLKSLISKHSTFSTSSPIYLWMETEQTTAHEEDEEQSDADLDVDSGARQAEVTKSAGWVHINDQAPIWMRDGKKVTDEEYQSFYQSHFKDDAPPLFWTHIKGDVGSTSFRALVYVPSNVPENIFMQNYVDLNALRLYVRRVFITNDLGPNFLPRWLQFVKVIIDADDLPLNVGRDSLQANKALGQIQRNVIKKTLDLFASKSEDQDQEAYQNFYKVAGSALKLGAHEDSKLREKLMGLLRWPSSQSPSTSIEDYISRRRQGQYQIYYAAFAGGDVKDVERSPFVERIAARGYEVLWFLEPLDEMLAVGVKNWQSMIFQDVAKKGIKMDEDDAEKAEAQEFKETYQPLSEYLKKELGAYINEVAVSTRLTTSPCAVVTDNYAWTGNMERLMAAQGTKGENDSMMQEFFKSQKKLLEINPRHPLIQGLLDQLEAVGEEDEGLRDTALTLFDTSMVLSNFPLRDPHAYFARVEKLLRRTVGVRETEKTDPGFIRPVPNVEEGPLKPAASDVNDDASWTDWSDFQKGTQQQKRHVDMEHDEL